MGARAAGVEGGVMMSWWQKALGRVGPQQVATAERGATESGQASAARSSRTPSFTTVDKANMETVGPLMRALSYTPAVEVETQVRDLREKWGSPIAALEGNEDEVLARVRENLEAVNRKRGFDHWNAAKYGDADDQWVTVGALIKAQPPYIYPHFIRRTAEDRYTLYPAEPPSYQMQ